MNENNPEGLDAVDCTDVQLRNSDIEASSMRGPGAVEGQAPLPVYPTVADLPPYSLADAEFIEWLGLPSITPPVSPRGRW